MLVAVRPPKGRAGMSRRQFLRFISVAALGGAFAGASGCAVNPVTGEKQLMLVSEKDEIAMDRTASPQQFSADYGPVQDSSLNAYISQVGNTLSSRSHRPQMPYSYRVVNAPYVNAYAFPGGSIAATRGIMLELDNEAELAALMGHEIGHVNARHTASRMSSGMMVGMVVGGAATAAGAYGGQGAADMAGGLGALGGSLLLANYSRDDERQADALGMEYMTRGGYSNQGMVGLMDMLNAQHKRQPSSMEVLFSTHPMSSERHATAVHQAETEYAFAKDYPLHRERYMDKTAQLRRTKPAIEAMQQGDAALAQKKPDEARQHYARAIKAAPRDYTAQLKMAELFLVQEDFPQAVRYAEQAQRTYPSQAQAYAVSGTARMMRKDFDAAYAEFDGYDKALPGNPNIAFFMGYCREGMGDQQGAAKHYAAYLKRETSGDKAQYAYQRLVQWGYVRQ